MIYNLILVESKSIVKMLLHFHLKKIMDFRFHTFLQFGISISPQSLLSIHTKKMTAQIETIYW